ncbi:hypothetical protein Hanom_Chr02g00116721 [Helianthus anomalus]
MHHIKQIQVTQHIYTFQKDTIFTQTHIKLKSSTSYKLNTHIPFKKTTVFYPHSVDSHQNS